MTFACLIEFRKKICESDKIANFALFLLDGNSADFAYEGLETVPAKRSMANEMTRSALVLLCGYFEGYLKKIIEEFVETFNSLDLPLKGTEDLLLLSIFQKSITENREKSLPKALQIKKCLIEDICFPLTTEAIGKTNGNPTVDTVDNLFQRIGIPEIIDTLSIQDHGIDSTYITVNQSQKFQRQIEQATGSDVLSSQKIIEFIDSQWTPTKKRREVGYVGIIQELLKKRNRIAHGENWDEQVTPQELINFNSNILKLCEGISLNLEKKIHDYQ
ncbi:MAE_28990/MAE_18760 family HEPN-like nuclease [Gluconobacter cerinus]|uniref:MAE_28990/MAE_18760 family HEPN-like nuclease n=1 Tax=Gluconobacter cerinus TaxID=38307 RepID=UPI001B8B1BAF|nr:MAE_28990/MAE_18760 family HEPN-like nuclease [Gluconobacter cerinus]MBS0984130.1 hypothetical protein [Gluconobacter cerinus]